jgi:2-iminobutanoate/2-iminopropanoate deaminase
MKALYFLFYLMSALSLAAQKEKQVIQTNKAPAAIGPYSQAIRAGNTVYVSGQIGLRPDGYLDSSSIETETKQALDNIAAILKEAKLEMKHVVKSSIFLTDLQNFKKVNEIYTMYFQAAKPARETVEVKALPKGAHIEISVIAVD